MIITPFVEKIKGVNKKSWKKIKFFHNLKGNMGRALTKTRKKDIIQARI